MTEPEQEQARAPALATRPGEPTDDLAEFLEAIPTEARVDVWRWSDEVGDYGFLGRLDASMAGLEQLAKRYGGGRYKVRVNRPKIEPDGTVSGSYVYGGQRQFYIDAAAREKPAEPGSNVGRLLEGGIVQLMQLQTEALKSIVGHGSRDITADLLKAILERDRPAAEGSLDTALKLVEFLDRTRTQGGDWTEQLEKTLSVIRELGAGGEGGDGALGRIADRYIKLVERMDERERAADRLAPGRGVPAAGPAWLHLFAPHLPLLVNAANGGGDPRVYAEVILDRAGDRLDVLKAMAQDADGTLAALPEAAQRVGPWFRRLLTELDYLIEENAPTPEGDHDDHDHPVGGPGDTGDPGGDA